MFPYEACYSILTGIFRILVVMGRGSYTADHGNLPILATEFGKIVYVLSNFGNRILSDTEFFYFHRYLKVFFK